MLEKIEALSPDKYSHVLKKLIDVISRAPAGDEGLQGIFKETLSSLEQAIGVERASVLLFDPDGVMRFKAWLGISSTYRGKVEGHTPWSEKDYNPPPLVTHDIYDDKELAPYYPVFEAENIRGLAFIPLLYRGRVIGKFMLYSRTPYGFAEEIEPASTIAQLVAYAVVRKKIEEQLALSETRLQAILDNEPECVNIINPEGIVLEMNPAGLMLFGSQSGESVIGKSILPLIKEEYRPSFQDLVKKVCQGEKGSLEFEITPVHGQKKVVEMLAVPFSSESLSKTVLLAITRDITEKKRVEEEREKQLQLRDDFLSIASHELKTPLTPILMNFQLVEKYIRAAGSQFPKSDLMLKLFENTDQQIERFLKLVENLLDVSRITADRMILHKEDLDLSKLIKDIVERFEDGLLKMNRKVNLRLEEGIVGQFDKVRMEQVILNLFSNAMKYGLDKSIDVNLVREVLPNQDWARLEVRDYGIGIAPADQNKIFSRFERAASANHFGGLGLGLYISKSLIEAHNGEITFVSEPCVGSTFTVRVPLSALHN